MTDKELMVMDRIHNAQLKLLKEFDRVCEKYNIKYYLAAGTLLGAVRHKDFIPWDDDVDVYILREDYKEFMNHLNDFQFPFEVHWPQKDDTYFWDYTTRLVYKKSKLKFDKNENEYYNHRNNEYLFLDIFVLDRTYEGIKNRIQLVKLKTIYGLAMSRRYKINYQDYTSPVSKVQAFILTHLGKLFKLSTLYRMYEIEAMKYNNDPQAIYEQPSNITIKFLGKLFYKKEWHKEITNLEIHGEHFKSPLQYEEVLESVYGNYMKLPPENLRIPEHVDSLDKIMIE